MAAGGVRDASGLERGVRHTGLIVRQVGLIIGKWKMRRIIDLEIDRLDTGRGPGGADEAF